MQAQPVAATYFRLLLHQWRQVSRTFVKRRHWLLALGASLLFLYMVFALISLGFLWREMVAMVQQRADPIALLNRHLLTIFLALFTLRLFVQRPPRVRARSYLHLPLSRTALVVYFQLASLATIHNVFPFLFFLPLWVRHIAGGAYGPAASWAWLVGVVLLILLSHYLNTIFRIFLGRNRESFFIAFGLLTFALALDLFFGPGALNAASSFAFDTLVLARPLVLLLPALLVIVVVTYSSLLMRDDLLSEDRDTKHRRLVLWQVPFRPPSEPLSNLVLLELKLMWRCERPKLYFLVSVVFGLIYVAIPLVRAELLGSTIVQALTSMFASGIFAFNYGQLMFSWESTVFDGILTKSVALRDMVMAKFIILQGSCIAFFLLSVPLFVALAPDLVPMHVALLFYNVGMSTVMIMVLALNNNRRVTLARVGFFTFEGFSLLHWLWYIPMVVPPVLVLYVLSASPATGLIVLGLMGLASYIFTPQWSTFFARILEHQRYEMAAGFRDAA